MKIYPWVKKNLDLSPVELETFYPDYVTSHEMLSLKLLKDASNRSKGKN